MPEPGHEQASTARREQTSLGDGDLLGQALSRENMVRAWKRVKANKGSAGVDGRTVLETGEYLEQAWPDIRAGLLDGSYRPEPVRRVGIPKPGGGTRELGIPTVVDRLIQQALLQVLQPRIDPTFSEHSHGFRPGRSAHGAVLEAQQYVQAGHHVVVDVDLEKFFDRVNHDILMDRLAKRIADKRVLRLIRLYLQAGVLAHGVCSERFEGTPQGGPLSPLLANVLLDEVDRELERRGHKFVRYADDCNVYVRSRRAGERVLQALRGCYAKLALTVNEPKTAVASVWGRKFLGYCFWAYKGKAKRAVARPAQDTLQARLHAQARASFGAERLCPTYEAVRQLDLFEALATEAGRLRPVAPVLAYEPLEDVRVGGVHLPAGTCMFFLTRPPTLDPAHFAHPGRYLAGVEMRLVLSMLMRNFSVSLAVDPARIREVLAFTLMPSAMPVRGVPRADGAPPG